MIEKCEFETERLTVRWWHQADVPFGRTLPHVIAGLLTARITATLPESWHGEYATERAQEWIDQQDSEGTNLLVTRRSDRTPIGLLLLGEGDRTSGGIEVRLGYVIEESSWRQGFASELVEGLIEWAATTPGIDSLTGGVSLENLASARVLRNNGFVADRREPGETEQIFRRQL